MYVKKKNAYFTYLFEMQILTAFSERVKQIQKAWKH